MLLSPSEIFLYIHGKSKLYRRTRSTSRLKQPVLGKLCLGLGGPFTNAPAFISLLCAFGWVKSQTFSLLRKLTGVTQGYVKVNVLPLKVNSSLLKVSAQVVYIFSFFV